MEKIVNNSTLHLGAYLNDKPRRLCHLEPLDKRKVLPLVGGTKLEWYAGLNRMAFSDDWKKIAKAVAWQVAFRLIKNIIHIWTGLLVFGWKPMR